MTGPPDFSRRDLLRGVWRPSPETQPPGSVSLRVLHRPPGAVDEPAFLAGCTRCGDCITACPVDAITLADPRAGTAAGTPIIDPARSPCVMCADTPCIPACEPGVLTHAAPLTMGEAKIDPGTCLAWQGTLCTVCEERCPVDGAIANVNGRPVVDAARCTGCGVCQYVCPAPSNAVAILPRERAAGADVAAPDTGWRSSYFEGRSLRAPWEQ